MLYKMYSKNENRKKIWVDKGKEFYKKHVQQLVELYSTENAEKSSVVERWNRTIKEKMFKYFTANSTSFYEQELQKTTQEIFRIEKVIRRKGDKSLVKCVIQTSLFRG